MRSVLDVLDLSVEEIDSLIETATDIIANPKKYAKICEGKKLATMFFEPSTRTRLSFEAAIFSTMTCIYNYYWKIILNDNFGRCFFNSAI